MLKAEYHQEEEEEEAFKIIYNCLISHINLSDSIKMTYTHSLTVG